MRLEFHPQARIEYLDAISFYEARQETLGVRFVLEIESAIRCIVDSPDRWPAIEGDVRRCLSHIFPYGILYSIEPDHVLVLAVMHHSRKPGYWRNRIKPA